MKRSSLWILFISGVVISVTPLAAQAMQLDLYSLLTEKEHNRAIPAQFV